MINFYILSGKLEGHVHPCDNFSQLADYLLANGYWMGGWRKYRPVSEWDAWQELRTSRYYVWDVPYPTIPRGESIATRRWLPSLLSDARILKIRENGGLAQRSTERLRTRVQMKKRHYLAGKP